MALRVLQTAGWYFPESTGGTEVYVSSLAKELRSHGIESLIAAPKLGHSEATYELEGTTIYRYPLSPQGRPAQQRGYALHEGFDRFKAWLAKQAGTIYHQHSLTLGCGVDHLEAAKRLGLSTVVTVHTAGPVCLRGSLMRFGASACDGRVDAFRCGACWAQARGIPRPIADVLARVPLAVSSACISASERYRSATALATRALVTDFGQRLERWSTFADRIIVPCVWLLNALRLNGVAPEKIVLSRQGVSQYPEKRLEVPRTDSSQPLRIGFIGRCSPLKGLDILIKAVRQLPADVAIDLFIYALPNDQAKPGYEQEIRTLAADDGRIHWEKPVTHDQIFECLGRLDVLAVPSRTMETGPLVVLEAFAAGVPVIGSRLGGIAELVQHDHDGALVTPEDIQAWSDLMKNLANDRERLHRWQRQIPPVRTMKDVAAEMATLYHEVAA